MPWKILSRLAFLFIVGRNFRAQRPAWLPHTRSRFIQWKRTLSTAALIALHSGGVVLALFITVILVTAGLGSTSLAPRWLTVLFFTGSVLVFFFGIVQLRSTFRSARQWQRARHDEDLRREIEE